MDCRPPRRKWPGCLGVAKHVQGDAGSEVGLGADAVNGFLHLTVAPVSPFDDVGSRRQQLVIEKGECLLDIGREERLERLADGLEAAHALAQASQVGQGGLGAAAAVEQPVDFIHDLAQRAQLRQAARDALQGGPLTLSEMALDEQVAVCEEVTQLLLLAGTLLGQLAQPFGRTATWRLRELGGQLLAHLGHGVQYGVGQVTQDVKSADLMGNRAENGCHRRRVAASAIGGDGADAQATRRQRCLKALEEGQHVGLGGIVVEHLVGQALEAVGVHDGEHTERAIVEFIGR
jgi:hypothetical protein